MSFQFKDSMIHDFWTSGYLIFKGIVPGSLLKDLRVVCDQARELAWELHGPQAHRLQPIEKYAEKIDQQPFQDYCDLPELADAVTRLLGDDYSHGHLHVIGILVEPQDHTWCQGWHRDGMVEVPVAAQTDPEVIASQKERWLDARCYNQVNCAVYRDATLWYVPGSHLRMANLTGEVQNIRDPYYGKKDPETSEEEFERRCLDYAREFPGAQRLLLEPGDFMIYRSNAWHCAHLVKYQPRATIHDTVAYHGGKLGHKYNWSDVRNKAREKYKKV